MKRRQFLKLSSALVPLLSGCAYARIDPWHYLVRSDRIASPEEEREILSRASLGWTDDGRIRVLTVRGTPYERGYQHGALLRDEIQDNLGYMYERAVDKFHSAELFSEAYERSRPFIPQEYVDEMHGLAHGSRLPLDIVHAIHILPSITEWGGKKRLKSIVKQMMAGELGTSCSNFAVLPEATSDGSLYTVRILDWGLHRISKLHEYPLLMVSIPESGIPNVNITWMGFLGSISGMNARGITLGEMGYGDPENETLRGKPMPFLLRDVLSQASSLADVRRILKESPGDMSFVFLMSDGKSGEAEMYIKDNERFIAARPGEPIEDGDSIVPPIEKIVYGGHDVPLMTSLLTEMNGRFEPEMIMKAIIPPVAMKSNFQNVLYDPSNLRLWVSYAGDANTRAAERPYTFFDLRKAIGET